MKEYDVVVVGAGAAGMMAAIGAASRGAKTAILEHMEQAGKKILYSATNTRMTVSISKR